MLCPYCGNELTVCGYYICSTCKIAMTDIELGMAIRAKQDREMLERMTGRKILEKEGKL